MLCAPWALQMVTCGPIAPGIHSVPAISDKHQPHAAQMRHDALGARRVGIGNPHIDIDIVVELVGQRDELDFRWGSRRKVRQQWLRDIRLVA